MFEPLKLTARPVVNRFTVHVEHVERNEINGVGPGIGGAESLTFRGPQIEGEDLKRTSRRPICKFSVEGLTVVARRSPRMSKVG